MNEYVHLDVSDEVATVTLDHPDVRNALTREVSEGLCEAMADVEDADARCVVLTGSEGVFCSGGDLRAMAEGLDSDDPPAERIERALDRTAAAVKAVATCDLPTVAALDGPAYGAGASLAVACDVLIASADAQISFGFRRVGLSVDCGASYFLPRLVGEHVAKELIYTGELVPAQRARELGLVNRVYPAETFEDEVRAFAERVAEGPTVALSNSKRLVEQGLDSSLDAAMDNEAAAQAVSAATADHEEGVRAFLDHRDPEFEGE